MEIKDLNKYSFGSEAKNVANEIELATKPTFMQKNLAFFIDSIIVFTIRLLIASIYFAFWYNIKFLKLLSQVSQNNSPFEDSMWEVFQILIKNGLFFDVAIFITIIIFSGGLYYIIFNASKFCGTCGCKLYDIKILNFKTMERLSFFRSFLRYFFYIVPFFFAIFIIREVIIYKNFTEISRLLFLISAFWYDSSLILRTRRSVPEILSGTITVSTRKITQKKGIIAKFFNKTI